MPPIWIPSYQSTINRLSSLPKLGAEKRVAEALNKIEGSDVWIFHSLEYAITRPDAAVTDLEIDFLVIWKNRGFLILEVKGGRVEFDALEKKWWRTSKGHCRQKISRSPVDQVKGQRNDLCKILPKIFPEGFNVRNIVERALVFPDVPLSNFKNQSGQKPERVDDFEIESIVTQESISKIADFVDKKLEPCARHLSKGRTYIPAKLFEDTVNLLRPSVRAEVSPKHVLEEAEDHIEAITTKQKEHLKHVINARWLLMDGPAGSAKTVLGLSAITSWLAAGENAYYITANEYLVNGLRKDSRYSYINERILSIHEFLMKSFDMQIHNDDSAMVEVLNEWSCPKKNYSIVLDEAQDLNPDLYESIVSLLPCERLWVLRDNRQSLEQKNDSRQYEIGQLQHGMPYTLTENCRNALPIAKHIARYVSLPFNYANDSLPMGDRVPDEIIVNSEYEQDLMLLEILNQGIKDGYSLNSLVVLSCLPDGRESVKAKYGTPSSNNHLYDKLSYGGEDHTKTALYHCLDFRGLESAFVIVTDIKGQESVFRANYLAGSRAKVRLIFIRIESEAVRDARTAEIPVGLAFD